MQKFLDLLEDCELSPAAFGHCSHELRGVLPSLHEPFLRIRAALVSFCAATCYDECAKAVLGAWLLHHCRWDLGVGISIAIFIYVVTVGEPQ